MKKIIIILMISILYGVACTKDNTDNSSSTATGKVSENGKGTLKGIVEEYVKGQKTGPSVGVTVQLLNGQGQVMKELTTCAIGGYKFTQVPSGSYYIRAHKDGFYTKPYEKKDGTLEQQRPAYVFTADKDTVCTASVYNIHKKAGIGISSMRWYQYSTVEQGTGVYVDIVFTNWIPSDGDVSLYIFAGFDQQISKSNFNEKLSRNGVMGDVADGYVPGYIIAIIPASKISNGKVTAYREMSICGWLGGSLHAANPKPRYYAVYSVNTYAYKTDGLIGDRYHETGDAYSGISDLPPFIN